MKIQTTVRNPISNSLDGAKMMSGIVSGESIKVEIDVAAESKSLASNLESLNIDEQKDVVEEFRRVIQVMEPRQQKSLLSHLAMEDKTVLAGGMGGLSVGMITATLKTTNNPYLLVAGCIAGGLALGYGATKVGSWSLDGGYKDGIITGSISAKGGVL